LVSFWDHTNFLAQTPLSNGIASFTLPSLSAGSHVVSATYNSDTIFASSSGSVVAATPFMAGLNVLSNGWAQLSFTNSSGAPFSVLGSGDMSVPLSNWSVLGSAVEILPGQFQFTDSQTTNSDQQFYRVRSP
jgi:hypothetical protein